MNDSPFSCWVDCEGEIPGNGRRYELTEEQAHELHVSRNKDQYIRDLCEAGAFPEMEVGEIPVAYGGHLEDR